MPASFGTQSVLPKAISQCGPILAGIWFCTEVDLLEPLQKRAIRSPSGAQTMQKHSQFLSIDKSEVAS